MTETDPHKVRSVDDASQTELPGADDSAPDGSVPLTDWSAGQVILDDYVVERELGQGGMGKVYLLRSRSTGQPFAVKRALLRNENSRRDFLAELRTWIDLPEHPHLVACRFFRTVGDEVVIFAEFVEGGSLADWIRERRLTSLEQILDAAIQFAWGLHAAHELGLVHQDVKPGNALMTADGLVKVADFGLARARATTEGQTADAAGQSTLVSYGGMTAAYCSPEQAQRQPLSRQTDVWSWGVAVLEMFVGEVTWKSGQAAPEALQACLTRPTDPELPAMPNDVAEVLQQCFRRDPAERWGSMAEAADKLQCAYREVVGKEYSRPMPVVPTVAPQGVANNDRRATGGGNWDDPRAWLVKAVQADARDPAEVERLLTARAGSRKAQAIADMAAYEEALRIFERLVAEGRNELAPQLAELCTEKAFVHRDTDDRPGAIALYDRAIAIFEQIVDREGRPEQVNDLATAYMYKAVTLNELGNGGGAVALYDRAIAIFERLVERDGRRDLAHELAQAYMNKGIVVRELGDKRAAVAMHDRAVAIYDGLENGDVRRNLGGSLARACMNYGIALRALGDNRAAVVQYDRAIGIYESLVEAEGRRDLADELAAACVNKGNALRHLEDDRAAVAQYDRAIAIRERLVEQEGRRQLANALATAYMNKGSSLRRLGDYRAAVAQYDRAIAIRERLLQHEGRLELRGDLATAVVLRAKALLDLGELQRARSEARKALPVLEEEIARTGRADLKSTVDWAKKTFQEELKHVALP